MKMAYAKRSTDPKDSPSKKQGNVENLKLNFCNLSVTSATLLFILLPSRCEAQEHIHHGHAEEERKEDIMFVHQTES